MKIVSLPTALFVALYTACSTTASPLSGAIPNTFVLAPLHTPPPPPSPAGAVSTQSHIISDSYLVVLQDHLEEHEVERHHAHVHALHQHDRKLRLMTSESGEAGEADHLEGIVHKYNIGKKSNKAARQALKGYSGKFSSATLDAIRAMRDVKYVEKDSLVWASDIERDAPWGLARLSHRKPLSFGTFSRYEYDGEGGRGVDAYVIDTGVNIEHVEFEGRAKWGKTIPKDPDQDLNGHGTHVAGTVASAKYGVAKKANIIAVKVLGAGGSGTMSDVVAGVAWAADAAYEAAQKAAKGKNPKHKGSVANMSLGGGKSPALDQAVNAAVDDGLHFAVAAGNDNKDACGYSPASAENAITVGASTIADERAYFSNTGKCVDLFAPGLNIRSTWNTGKYSVNTISGTSMASPHVCGLMAYFLSLYPSGFNVEAEDFTEASYDEILNGPASYLRQGAQIVMGKLTGKSQVMGSDKPLSPKALKNAMIKLTSRGILSDISADTPNLLVYNNYTDSSRVLETLHASVVELEA